MTSLMGRDAKSASDDRASWLQRNSLAIACFTIFVILLVAQSLTGWRTYNA